VRTGRRVVLIDGDMRSPSVHKLIGTANARGLSNFLAGDDDLQSLLQKDNKTELSILSAGPQPPSAAELLAGDRLSALMHRLGELFDHAIIDAPPVMGLADAPLLGSNVEGVVFVVESGTTRTTTARVAVDRLLAAQNRLVG